MEAKDKAANGELRNKQTAQLPSGFRYTQSTPLLPGHEISGFLGPSRDGRPVAFVLVLGVWWMPRSPYFKGTSFKPQRVIHHGLLAYLQYVERGIHNFVSE